MISSRTAEISDYNCFCNETRCGVFIDAFGNICKIILNKHIQSHAKPEFLPKGLHEA
jgi:hypothetical protein